MSNKQLMICCLFLLIGNAYPGQSFSPIPVDTTKTNIHGYIWDETGPVIRVLDAGDIGLEGLEVVAVDLSTQNIVATTVTDENGFFQFNLLTGLIDVYLTSLPDEYRVVKQTTVSKQQWHGTTDHHGRVTKFYGVYDRSRGGAELSEFGIKLKKGQLTGRHSWLLPLIKKIRPETKQAVIEVLAEGYDIVADGIHDRLGSEPHQFPFPTFQGSKEYILYDDQMRPLMASPFHTGEHSSGRDSLFMPVDATREYTLCVSPSDDISHFIPRQSKQKIPNFAPSNDFNPETGCALLNIKNDFSALLLLTKNLLPEKLFGSVWLHEQIDDSTLKFTQAPAVSVTLYRAGSNTVVATAQSGIKILDHGIEVPGQKDDSNLIYFPDDLQPGGYYLCADTRFKEDGFKISTLSNFDPDTTCTAVFQFPEQRQSHTPSLILERVTSQPTPTEPVAGNQISGFVWLDNNTNGLQDADEPGFAKTIEGLGAPVMVLYQVDSTESIAVSSLDENSSGHFLFENIQSGNYYVCMSREYDVLGLSVTTQDAGNDAIDNDFDDSPCAYDIIVTDSQGADIDLGLTGGPLDPVDPLPTDPGSLGKIHIHTETQSIDHRWQSASDVFNTDDLVIFYSAPSNNGVQRGVARMRRTDGQAQYKYQEWSNLDGFHANEIISLIGFPQGSWSNANTQIEVGTTSISGTRQWKTIGFTTGFTTPPTVILSLQTANGSDAVDVHVRNITTTSMQVALFEEQAKMGSGHLTETVGYLLVASDTDGFDLNNPQATRVELPYMNTGILVNHDWKTMGDGYQIRLEEDRTNDQETIHVFENVHVVKINDHYLTQIVSANGGDPAVLRSHRQ